MTQILETIQNSEVFKLVSEFWFSINLSSPWLELLLITMMGYFGGRLLVNIVFLIMDSTGRPSYEQQRIFLKSVFNVFGLVVALGIGIQLVQFDFRGEQWLFNLYVAVMIGSVRWFMVELNEEINPLILRRLSYVLSVRISSTTYWLIAALYLAYVWISWPIPCAPKCVGASLTNVNMNGLELRYANLTNANLRGSSFQRANLTGTNFVGAQLDRANFQGANLTDVNFSGANLTNVDFGGAKLENTNFSGANLSGANLTSANFRTLIIDGAILDGAKLIQTNMAGVDYPGGSLLRADLTNANLRNTNLRGTQFGQADLSGANLTGAKLNGSVFNLANLSDTEMANADLSGSLMIGADLLSSDMSNSRLVGVNFIGANLSGANLSGSNLTSILMFRSEFDDSLKSTDVTLASLNAIEMSAVLKNVDYSGIITDENVVWPPEKERILKDLLGIPLVYDEVDPETLLTSLPKPNEVSGDISIYTTEELSSIYDLSVEGFAGSGFRGTMMRHTLVEANEFLDLCTQTTLNLTVYSMGIPSEADLAVCESNGVALSRFPIGAQVALVAVVNPINTGATQLSTSKLGVALTVERWSDVESWFRAEDIERYLPIPETPGFDILSEVFTGGRDDILLGSKNTFFVTSNVDVILGVTANENAIGFLDYNYYLENQQLITGLKLDGANISEELPDTYPLAERLFVYFDQNRLVNHPELVSYIGYFMARIPADQTNFGRITLSNDERISIIQQLYEMAQIEVITPTNEGS
ncbi:MAG: pentapeptide repeat-containing protein [Phototrophicaceae bacterium]